ncbi:MAG: DUF503 domain-containing protein [Actinomycetota bacterium]|nr:DUF503 domain-containing protein [Actinomycetota bacterium]
MFVGVARFELFIPESRSLKDKRQIVRSVSMSIARKFNVAIAEVDHQNLWQRTAFGVSCVAESTGQCKKVLMEVEKSISRSIIGAAEIIDRSQNVFAMEDL